MDRDDSSPPKPLYRQCAGFDMSAGGLYRIKNNPDSDDSTDEPKRMRVCDGFEIVGQTRTARGESWGLQLRFGDADSREHLYIAGRAALHAENGALAAELASRGLAIAPVKSARDALIRYLASVSVSERLTIVSRTGWLDSHRIFVLPDAAIGKSAEVILLDSPHADTARYERRGSLDGWREHVARRAIDHSRLIFALSAAFVAPLLRDAEAEGGGFHFVGESSRGKTTLLATAASVWGRGDSHGGFVRTWRATDNGLEAAAAMHSDTLLPLDDIAQADAEIVGRFAYMLAQGAGKARATEFGRARGLATWRSIFLSTGEKTLAQTLVEDGARRRKIRAGQLVRMIDIPADAGAGFGVFGYIPGADEYIPGADNHDHDSARGAALADELRAAALADYGHAGPEFIARYIEDGASAIEPVRAHVAAWTAQHVPASADGQVRRVADRFAIVAAAGELAASYGITGWPSGAASEAAATCFDAWLDRRGGVGAHEITDGIAQVRLFLEQHGDTRFDPLQPMEDYRPALNRAGYRDGAGEGQRWYVYPEAWRQEVTRGFDPLAIARALNERGALDADAGRLTKQKRILGRARFYCVTSSIMDDDAENGA